MFKSRFIWIVVTITGLISASFTDALGANSISAKSSTVSPQIKYIDQLINQVRPAVLEQTYDSLTVNVDPVLKGSGWANDTTSNLTTALKLLHYFGFSSPSPLTAYISWGPEFRNSYIPTSCQYNSGGGSCGNGMMFADIKWFTDSWNWNDPTQSQYPDELDRMSVSANLPHEIGHVLQESAEAKSNSGVRNVDPAWLREGTAEFFKLLTYSIQNRISYADERKEILRYWKYCKSSTLDSLSGQGSYDSGCEYTRGLVAVEYLVWKMKSFNVLYRFQLAPGDTQSQKFQNAFKVSQKNFQAEADKYFVTATAKIPTNN